MTTIEKNASLESVSKTKDQLRNFNDLKRQDVITSIQMLKASKNIDTEITVYPSADVENKHFSLHKENLYSKKQEYEDSESNSFKNLNNEFEDELRFDAESQLDIREYANTASLDTEIKEISVDEAVRSIEAYSLSLKDHKDVSEFDKNTLLNELGLSRNEYSIELVLKDNLETFVLVRKEVSFLDEIKVDRDMLNQNVSGAFKTYKKLQDIILELYNDERHFKDSLKIFFDRYDLEIDNQDLHSYDENIIKDLRETLKKLN